ncbi:phosphatase PAP2 family protein [Streptosporangiaceae bacterium NEAU-GS5]|nr:phosphatase PAP2 family protein [Streptosporangiaceae bacterium NEAU-GS5]
MTSLAPAGGADRSRSLGELRALVDGVDRAVCEAIAGTATPRLDRLLVAVSNAANYSRLWLVTAAVTALVGGRRGRRAAGRGVLAIALTSAVTNLVLKPLAGRQRPAPSADHPAPESRRVRQPASRSFPSGHAASAFAFATAMGQAVPGLRLPAHVAAAAVAYSRVHTGVHYPSDVVIGAVVGSLCGGSAGRLAARLSEMPRHRGDSR